MCRFIQLSLLFLFALLLSTANGYALGRQVAPRDHFPVFNNPQMWSAAEAEQLRIVLPRDAVIGVAHGGEAKAYPVAVMGIHELGNDTIAGLPIAVGW